MQEYGAERRCKPGHLCLPVAQQRRRKNQERGFCALLALQSQEQCQNLDGLAEPHVVGQAGPEAQARQKPQPVDTRLLILTQSRFQGLVRRQRLKVLRAPHLRQHVAEPLAGMNERPLAVFLVASLLGQIGRNARQQSHSLQERNPLLRLLLDLLPMIERFLQFLAIDLDPLPTQHDQSVVSRHQFLPFGLAELLVAQRQLHLEIEHPFRVELLLLRVADRHADAGTGTFLPPVGQPHQNAALFKDWRVLEESISLVGRPGQRLVEITRVDQLLHQGALLRRQLHRR